MLAQKRRGWHRIGDEKLEGIDGRRVMVGELVRIATREIEDSLNAHFMSMLLIIAHQPDLEGTDGHWYPDSVLGGVEPNLRSWARWAACRRLDCHYACPNFSCACFEVKGTRASSLNFSRLSWAKQSGLLYRLSHLPFSDARSCRISNHVFEEEHSIEDEDLSLFGLQHNTVFYLGEAVGYDDKSDAEIGIPRHFRDEIESRWFVRKALDEGSAVSFGGSRDIFDVCKIEDKLQSSDKDASFALRAIKGVHEPIPIADGVKEAIGLSPESVQFLSVLHDHKPNIQASKVDAAFGEVLGCPTCPAQSLHASQDSAKS